jgi:hypothetical protein
MNLQWSSSARYLKSFVARMASVMVAALLLAQWGAQTHAYSHDEDSASRTDLQSHIKPCPQCPSFAPVLTVAGGAALFPAVHWAPILLGDSSVPVTFLAVAIALAFRSRAPPAAI